MTVPALTIEWICTRCGSTNRKLVAAETTRTTDRCLRCGTVHVLTPGAQPNVRWQAVPK